MGTVKRSRRTASARSPARSVPSIWWYTVTAGGSFSCACAFPLAPTGETLWAISRPKASRTSQRIDTAWPAGSEPTVASQASTPPDTSETIGTASG